MNREEGGRSLHRVLHPTVASTLFPHRRLLPPELLDEPLSQMMVKPAFVHLQKGFPPIPVPDPTSSEPGPHSASVEAKQTFNPDAIQKVAQRKCSIVSIIARRRRWWWRRGGMMVIDKARARVLLFVFLSYIFFFFFFAQNRCGLYYCAIHLN